MPLYASPVLPHSCELCWTLKESKLLNLAWDSCHLSITCAVAHSRNCLVSLNDTIFKWLLIRLHLVGFCLVFSPNCLFACFFWVCLLLLKEEGGKVKKPHVIQGKTLMQDPQGIPVTFSTEFPSSEAPQAAPGTDTSLDLVTKDTFPLLFTTSTLYTSVLLLSQLSCAFKNWSKCGRAQ